MKWLWEKGPVIVGRFVGLSAVAYVLGFLVFRSRMNALGVPGSALTVVDQTYLISGGELLIVSLDLLVRATWWLTFPTIAVLALVCTLGLRLLHRRQPAGLPMALRLCFTLLTLALLVLSLETAAHIIRAVSIVPRPPTLTEKLVIAYVVATLAAMAGLVLLRLAFSAPDMFAARRVLQTIGSLVGVLCILVVPMAFGVALTPREYPVAVLEVRDGGPSAASFLLFSNEKRTVTYRGGVIRIVPADHVSSITISCYGSLAKEPRCD